jgi:kinesin family protein 20
VSQTEIFRSVVLPRVKEFLEGQNQLLFTYGATSAGKTYTIQVQQQLSATHT